MSVEAARSFYRRLETDPELTRRLLEMDREDAELFIRGELGYEFTSAELRKILFEENPALADAELEDVVAGFSGPVGFHARADAGSLGRQLLSSLFAAG